MNNIINKSPKGTEMATFNVRGNNNYIYIGSNVIFNNVKFDISSSYNKIFICNNVRLSGSIIMKIHDSNALIIASGSTVGGANFVIGEGSKVHIGKDCMIAWGVEFRTTDSHAIYDINSHKRINYAKDIYIGNHCWIGAKSTILKGGGISNGSIVGYGSILTRKFTSENILVSGNPCSIKKTDVYWDRTLLG